MQLVEANAIVREIIFGQSHFDHAIGKGHRKPALTPQAGKDRALQGLQMMRLKEETFVPMNLSGHREGKTNER
jgi:hypothetical protein